MSVSTSTATRDLRILGSSVCYSLKGFGVVNVLVIGATSALAIGLGWMNSRVELPSPPSFGSLFGRSVVAIVALVAAWILLTNLVTVSDSLPAFVLVQSFVAVAPLLQKKWAHQRAAS